MECLFRSDFFIFYGFYVTQSFLHPKGPTRSRQDYLHELHSRHGEARRIAYDGRVQGSNPGKAETFERNGHLDILTRGRTHC